MFSGPKPFAKTVIYGASGHSKVVLALIEALGHYEITGVLDDGEAKRGNIVYGYSILGTRDQFTQLRAEDVIYAIVVIGDNFNWAELA